MTVSEHRKLLLLAIPAISTLSLPTMWQRVPAVPKIFSVISLRFDPVDKQVTSRLLVLAPKQKRYSNRSTTKIHSTAAYIMQKMHFKVRSLFRFFFRIYHVWRCILYLHPQWWLVALHRWNSDRISNTLHHNDDCDYDDDHKHRSPSTLVLPSGT